MNLSRWLTAGLLLPLLSYASINIPITVKDGAFAGDAAGVPVKVGVPLPMGTMEDVNTLRVTDAVGNTVPAQFDILGRWQPNSNSIRSVLVQFAADVVSSGRTEYFLRDDGTGNSSAGITYTENADRYTVNAGKLQFEIRKSRFNVIDRLWFDENGNHQFETSEEMIGTGDDNGAVLVDTLGVVSRDTAQSGLSFTVEESGPVRFALRVESTTPATPNGWGFIVRIYGYYNQPFLALDYYLKNSAYGATGHHVNFSKFALVNSIRNLGSATVRFGGAITNNAGAYEGSLGSSTLSAKSTAWQKFLVNGVDNTGLSCGYADISDANRGVMAVVRNYSQLWPSGLSVTADKKLSIDLWPAGRNHRLVDQTRRAHQIMLYFHGAATQADLFKQAKLFQKFPVPLLKPYTYSQAHAIGDFGGIYQGDSTWNPGLYTPKAIALGDSNWTGWWNWGGDPDRRLSSGYGEWPAYATTYISCGSPEAYYNIESRTRHYAEMRPLWMDGYVGTRDGGWLTIGYPPSVGLRPPNANLDYTCWSSWDYMHSWVFEVGEFYFFSGERYCAEYLRMFADFVLQDWIKYFYVTGEDYGRQVGEPIHVVLDAYKATGEKRYLDFLKGYAAWMVDHYTSKYGVFVRAGMQHGNFVGAIGDIYFQLPENTPQERELKERYLLMLEGGNNGQIYWGGNLFPADVDPARNSWGIQYTWYTEPYQRDCCPNYMVSYGMNLIGMMYFMMGDSVYRNTIKLMNVPYYGSAPLNVATSDYIPGWFRVSSAAWYDTAQKKAAVPARITTLTAVQSAAKKITLHWKSVGGTAYRVHWALKPIVEPFSPIADGNTFYPHPDTAMGVTSLYRCYAIDAPQTPKAVGADETFTTGPFADSLVGRKLYFDVQAVNIASTVDQSRSPLSNTDSMVLSSQGTDTTTPAAYSTQPMIKEACAMNSSVIIASLTQPITLSDSGLDVTLTEVANGMKLVVSGLEFDTACRALLRISTSDMVEGREYMLALKGPGISTSYPFHARFGQNIFSVRKFNFGSGYSENGYEGDHIFNGVSGWGSSLSEGCGYYGAVTTRDDLSGTPDDPPKYSMSAISCGTRYWFKMLVSPEIKDYRLKVCAGRGNYAPDSVFLSVEGAPVWNKAACAAAGKQWIFLDSIPIRIEDGMLDIEWSYLCYINLWPVTHFKSIRFTSISKETAFPEAPMPAFVENIPNPFNPSTKIRFSPGSFRQGTVRLVLYDMRGRMVRDLTPSGVRSNGVFTVEWNGMDQTGKRASSQVFLLRLTTGEKSLNRKIIMMK